MDVSGVKVGTAVVHKEFSDGTVIEIANGKIYICFDEDSKTIMVP